MGTKFNHKFRTKLVTNLLVLAIFYDETNMKNLIDIIIFDFRIGILSYLSIGKNDMFWMATIILHKCLNLKQCDFSEPNHLLY